MLKIYHPMVHTSTDLTDKYLKGYGSLLSFVLKDATPDVIERFVDSLKHFTLAYSWGGFESLVMPVWKGSNEEELKKRLRYWTYQNVYWIRRSRTSY